jgi:hypothetical protein
MLEAALFFLVFFKILHMHIRSCSLLANETLATKG